MGVLDPDLHKQEKKTQFVVDAVYALAYVLDKMQRHVCNETKDGKLCDAMIPLDGEKLFKNFLLDISFLGKGKLNLNIILIMTTHWDSK